jgi:hypothetical protein
VARVSWKEKLIRRLNLQIVGVHESIVEKYGMTMRFNFHLCKEVLDQWVGMTAEEMYKAILFLLEERTLSRDHCATVGKWRTSRESESRRSSAEETSR